ncbi:MAG: hypothetical protein DRH26_00065 [Deltaproteobacteria bacterium]|nr:MAG: hypothetical protein DRH26_00065 [Deltaproteobacteria bacterium]
MQLPKAVQAAAKSSDDLQKQLNDPKPDDQQGQDTPLPEDGTLTQQGPDTLNPDVAPTDPAQPAPDDWQQKYLTLQGKFNAQVPRLQQDIQHLQGQLSSLDAENKQLKEAATQPKTLDSHGDTSPLDRATISEYGEEFGTLVDTIEQLRSDNASLSTQIQTLSGDVTGDRQAQAKKAYDGYLGDVSSKIAALGGDFSVLNGDPNFLNWLRQYPEGEAEPRHAKLKRAEGQQDVTATMEIFTEYLRPTQPQAQPNLAPNLQPPTAHSSPAPTTQPEGRMWTRAGIAKFYQDKVKGVFKGRDEEAAQLEADIHAAPGEGRVS